MLPGVAVEMPSVFVIVRFATDAAIPTDACAALLPGAGSGVSLATLARFTIGSGFTYVEGTENVVVTVRVEPAASVPSPHG